MKKVDKEVIFNELFTSKLVKENRTAVENSSRENRNRKVEIRVIWKSTRTHFCVVSVCASYLSNKMTTSNYILTLFDLTRKSFVSRKHFPIKLVK